MNCKLRFAALSAALCSVLALPVGAQTAEEIVAKAIAARGGTERLKAVQSERITGTISFGPGAEGPFLAEFARPSKMHNEVTLGGKQVVRSFNGTAGWSINPFRGDGTTQPMSADEVHNSVYEADFDGPFVDTHTKGNVIALDGVEDVQGHPAYKLKVTHQDGKTSFYFVDKESFLTTKWQGTRENGGKSTTWLTYFHDYRDAGGLKFAFLLNSESPDVPVKQTISVDKIELDPQIDPAHFARPAGAEEPASGGAKPAQEPDKPNQ